MPKKISQKKKQDEKLVKEPPTFSIQQNLQVNKATIYHSFMASNWKLGKKELKRGINEIEDVPAFINRFRPNSLDVHKRYGMRNMEAEEFMWYSMQSFLFNHQCIRCKKFSLDKCSNCKIAHYCGQDCQEKDFDRHSKECNIEQKLMSVANRFIETRVIKKDLEIEDEEKNFMNFDSFISSLDFKIFEACFNLLATRTPEQLKNFKATSFQSHFKGFNLFDTELRTLLRNEPVPLDTICEQLN